MRGFHLNRIEHWDEHLDEHHRVVVVGRHHRNDAQLREEKVYVYPEDVSAARDAGLEVPSYTGTLALMFTSKRGMVPLYDIERGRLCSWRSQFPPAGLLVADAWSNVGLPLETISYQSATEYSMYFPSQ